MRRHRVRALAATALLLLGVIRAQAEGAGPRNALLRQLKAPAAPSQALPTECPTTDAGWVAWRDAEIRKLLALKPRRTKYLDLEDVMRSSQDIAGRLDQCKAAGRSAPEAIMANLALFVTTQRNANYLDDLNHQFGHTVDDLEYLRLAKPALELPCLLQSPLFLQKVSHPTSYVEALDLIKQQNAGLRVADCDSDKTTWETLIYRSRFLPTPDDAEVFGRLLVRVPGPDSGQGHDRWIQFGIWLPEDRKTRRKDYGKPINNVSIVAVAKGDDPRPGGRFDALADWWRVPKAGSTELALKFRRKLQPYETDNCMRCHKTVPVGIHPAKVYRFDQRNVLKADGGSPERDQVVAALNLSIFTNHARGPVYETSAAETFARPGNYGPAFGPDRGAPERTPASLRACTAPHGLNPRSVQRVIDNMGCAACHNGKPGNFGILNYPLATEKRTHSPDKGAQPNLIRAHILSGVMPIDDDGAPVKLQTRERAALYDCLSQEYFNPATRTGLFVDWLMNKPAVRATAGTAGVASATKSATGSAALLWSAGVATTPPTGYAQCAKCHKDTTGPRAPSLGGVFMRPFAGDPNYGKYSADLKQAGAGNLVWDEANLMAFLEDPDAFLTARLGRPAESNMTKAYADEAYRRTIVQYLMTLK